MKTTRVIFGGTFDPPHYGHIELVLTVLERGLADSALIIPAAKPPHKLAQPTTPFPHRLAMLELAVEKYEQIAVSDMEFERLPAPSFTITTMEELSRAYPSDELILLIGGDSLKQLHSWYESSRIVDNWKILTYPRDEETIMPEELAAHWTPEQADKLLNCQLDLPEYPISSTEIRRGIAKGLDMAEYLHPKVLEYIQTHKLYQD